jgi:hypothetical protein
MMVSRALTGALVALVLATEARAANLLTAPLAPEADGTLVCDAVNVGTADRDVTVWLFDSQGVLLNFEECFGLLPMTVCSTSSTNDDARTCKVIVKGAKNAVRAALTARSAAGVTTAAVPAE